MTNLQNAITRLHQLENELWAVTNSRSLSRGQKVIRKERLELDIRKVTKIKNIEMSAWKKSDK